MSVIGENDALIEFDTAWSAPIPVYDAIMKKFPGIQMHVDYADEDIGYNCGSWINGELIVPSDPVGFACDLWGIDEREYRDG